MSPQALANEDREYHDPQLAELENEELLSRKLLGGEGGRVECSQSSQFRRLAWDSVASERWD